MGGSAISVDVSAANGKLAQMLRKREEDESLLQIGKKKNRDSSERAKRGQQPKKARWREPADFSHPSPLVDRPRTESGATSFHFSSTTISKEGSPTTRGNPVPGFGGHGRTPGADHSAYVEREGAAERSLGAEHAVYVERDGAVESVETMALERAGRERSGPGEALSDEESAVLGRVEWEAVRSIFSNISTDQFEREEYWRAVHRTEREAKRHQVVVDPSTNPRWWREVETWPDVPEEFRTHCLLERDRHDEWRARDAVDPTTKPFAATPYDGDAEKCGEALDASRRVPGWTGRDSPVAFKSGRGGRVQFRFVAELPHEVTPEDRALIAQNFCDHLATFAKDEAGRPTGMMYTGVIHAPDSHNDRRNYHLHVIAHDRPAQWLPEHRQWDFEVAEPYNHKGEIRTRYPLRQPKIGEVSRQLNEEKRADKKHYNNDAAGAEFIPALRAKFAEINNAVLRARGIDRQLDPRRYEQMGIDRTPTEHLGTKAAALEATGVPTVVGRLNAIAIWTDAERAIRKRAAAVEATLASTQRDLRAFVVDAVAADPRAPETRSLRTLSAEREALVSDVAADRLELMIFDHLEAKAKSRAVRTRQTCLQTLAEAQRLPGIHPKETVRLVRQRYDEAQTHIERVDRELRLDRPRIAAAASDVLRRERRIQDIDALLAPLRQAMLERVERERSRDRRRTRDDRDRAADRATPEATRGTAETPAPEARPPIAADRPTTTPTAATPPREPTTRPAKETEDADRRTPDPARLLVAAGLRFPAPKPGPLGAGGLASAGALAGLHGLSGSGVVRDARRPPVLLQDLQPPVVGGRGVRQDEASGDGVRRPRDGDRADDGGIRTGLIPPAPAAPALPPVMAPPSVGGVPIVEPTLPVGVDAITPPRERDAPLPEGLTPLRPAPARTPAADATPIEADIDGTPSPARSEPIRPPGSAVPTPTATTPPTPADTQVDRRRREVDPALFEIGDSIGPTKPGTSKASYEEWDALVNRISRDRIQVVRERGADGRVRHDVPSLDAEQAALLRGDRYAKRTNGRLSAIHDQQAREIDRLARWIARNGRDPANLAIDGRTARLVDAPESVRSLMSDWRSHPRITEALRAEAGRRTQAAADAARVEARRRADAANAPAPTIGIAAESASNAARLATLASIYPDPADASTPQVRRLVELLRADAPPEDVRAAADAVRGDPIAREDVHRHRVELAQAYASAIEESDLDILLNGPSRRGGR